ncbi:MAG: hypothetical protein ABI193_16470 [Minicystis sp.]
MARYSESNDRVRRVLITPEITRAYWSKFRAFQGEKVKLYIETARAPDDLPLVIQIWEDGADTGDPDGFVAELKGPHNVKNNRYEKEYTVDFDPETLGRELILEGSRYEFYFLVKNEAMKISGRSTLLYVDLHPLSISS